MDDSNARVSSPELMTLQTDLVNLSNQLHELYELMNSDISQLSEYWRDEKFDEFLDGYKPQMEKMEEISERYHEWATKDLQVTIDNVIATEGVDVSGSSIGSFGSSSSHSKVDAFKAGIERAKAKASGKMPPKPDDSGFEPGRGLFRRNPNDDAKQRMMEQLLRNRGR